MCALPTSTSTDIHCSKLYADDNRTEIKRPLAFPAIDSEQSKVGYSNRNALVFTKNAKG